MVVFAIPAAAFLAIGIAWAYFAIKAIRERRWAVASLRAFPAAISFGVVVSEVVLVGNILQ